MSHRTRTKSRTWKERALSLLLAAVLLVGMAPGLTLPSSAHWADAYLDQMVDWGAIRADQAARPDAAVTRAEFMAIINRAYGYTEMGEIPFTDVSRGDWFYDDVAIAYTAGYMAGTSATTASPNATLTREMAVCILGRNMMLKETPGESLTFADSRDVSSWARGLVKTAVDNYIVAGYPNNTFQPKGNVTMGQMAVLVTQCVGNPIQTSGVHELGGVFGNVTITSPNVTLRNTTISGDLYVSGGVGLGGIKLENVNVLGRIIVSGTGESEAGDASVVMRNVTANEMLVDNMRNRTVTIRADGITEIGETTVRTHAYLEDNNTDDKGLMHITLDGEPGTQLTLAGRIKEVTNKTPSSTIQVAKGTVAKLTVDEAANNSTVQLDRNTEVKELNLDVATNVTGDGDIGKLNVNAPGCVVSMLPDKIYIRPGLTANIAGVVMDHLAAEEGSTDPRIMSGYPKAADIAPTGFRAEFSGNKRGTIYWAVSTIADGSIGADDLISPPTYASKAVANGSVAVPAGDTVVTAQVTGLITGGSYYLSAVLVDGQNNRSAVKVISFTTPDNTVPGFAQGYPYMSRITDTEAQVTVMPTKSCKLYYAVLPRGAQAPTANELKAASVTGNLGYGVVDVTKNTETVIDVSRRLKELTDYTLYLWLTDADGANSSAVTPLQFRTVDATPPVFVVDPYVKDVQANSVGLGATLNENGTIFWVVVEDGTDYPKPNNQNPDDNEEDGRTAKLDSDFAKLQVANGMNCLRSGRVAATANREVTLNVTGLQPEKTYDLYYLAQDAAGNYSISVMKIQGGIHTLDTSGPIVKQYFTKFSGVDNTKDPMSDTDIVLEFNENICLSAASAKDIMSLYQATQTGSNADRAAAMKNYEEALQNSFKLFRQVTAVGEKEVNVRGYSMKDGNYVPNNSSDWVVDYTQVRVEKTQEGAYRVIFPTDGLQLSSGSTYFFKITGVTDNSVAKNPIRPNTVQYDDASIREGHSVPKFTVVFARVFLTQVDLTNKQWPEAVTKEPAAGAYKYKVDFSFRMIPDATQTVEPGMAYDLLLWTDTTIRYDLYYRVVESSGGKPVTDGSWTDKNGKTHSYNMMEVGTQPSRPEADKKPDANGWVHLGDSQEILTNGTELFGKSLQVKFNGCNEGSFPDINTLDDTGSVYYEFAVSIKKMGTGPSSTNPATWSGTVNYYVDAAAGTSGNLYRLNTTLSEDSWNTFTTNGLGTSFGGESIGSTDNRENPKRLKMSTPFSDSLQPSFAEHFPTFDAEDVSVTMNLTLDRPGTVYYAIAPADNTGRELADEATWVPTIRTLISGKKGASNDPADITKIDPMRTILPSEVPEDGDDATRMINNKILPVLGAPEKGNIFRPQEWAEAGNAITGSVQYQGVATRPVTISNQLEPNRTYYAYFVITGTAREPSEVYIYKFKTNPTARPIIELKPVDSATSKGVNMTTTNMNSYLSYVVYPESDLKLIYRMMDKTASPTQSQMLKDILSDEAKAAGGLPKKYEDMTILDALVTKYSFNEASSEGPSVTATTGGAYYPKDGKNRYTSFDGYSVFDIYASDQIKQTFYNWLSTGVLPVDVTYTGTKAPTTAQTGKDINITQNRNSLGGDLINPGANYYILTVARSQVSNSNDAAADVCSFLAQPFRLSDQDPPNLDSASGSFSADSTTGSSNAGCYVSLSFDKPLYAYNSANPGNPTIISNTNFFPGGNPTCVSSVSVTQTGTVTTVRVNFNASQYISAEVGGGYLTNSSGIPATNTLSFQTNRVQEGTMPNGTTPFYVYYLDVYWGTTRVAHIRNNQTPANN